MTERSGSEHGSGRSRSSLALFAPFRLSWVAIVLFVLFGTLVIGAALPPKLADPSWQLGVVATLLNSAGFPLVGMALMHLAADLAPDNAQLAARRRFCARLAVPVVFGFLLLIPLQTFALWQQSTTVLGGREAQLARAERNLQSLRQAVEGASSIADLQKRLQAISSQQLSATELAAPLPVLKSQAKAALQQAERLLDRQRQALPRGGVFVLAQAGLRNLVACLALALGFAALAQRPRSMKPLLQEWLHGFSQAKKAAYWKGIIARGNRKHWPYR
ncbi:MAG: hypothetical protein VKI83_03205 [Synechococcaceae cyanobacterium]|nr:hypothetical protein [Synechococcaceae cyanobacterium]